MRLLVILLSAIAASAANKVSYENFKVYKMMLKNEHEKQFIQDLVNPLDESTNYWSGLSLSLPTSVMVAPKDLDNFLRQMNASGIDYELFIDNVQDLITSQKACKNKADFNWTCYHTLDEIYEWLDGLSRRYPEQIEVVTGGYTYEDREIRGVKISFKANNPGVFIESGIHSYEWIAPATATYLINELLTSEAPTVRELAESYDWYIFPSVNPDGYVYTFTGDRMWSKNRSKAGNSTCMGVNLNRNWDYMYKSGTNPCDPKYAGVKPSTEVEIVTLSRYIGSIRDKLFSYISFHSFAQLLMVPYFYTLEHLDNYNDTIVVANKAAEVMSQRYGSKYTVGTGAEVMYGASGVSVDWVKGNLKVPMVFAYELRDTGDFGMLLPPDQIVPTGREILDSLVVMFAEARRLGYPK